LSSVQQPHCMMFLFSASSSDLRLHGTVSTASSASQSVSDCSPHLAIISSWNEPASLRSVCMGSHWPASFAFVGVALQCPAMSSGHFLAILCLFALFLLTGAVCCLVHSL
jgi:hypothetical protein